MNKCIDILENLLSFNDEYEWFDFKENWFSKDEIGEYISAISNGAALCGKEYGYIVWGIEDEVKNIVGTNINFDKDIDNEPYKHYLARNLKPSIAFEVKEFSYQDKRIVMLIIPSAKSVPVTYMKEKYIRIGSSKEKLSRYPEWEMKLNSVLMYGFPTIVNTPAPDYAQELTFEKLFMYYAAKGIALKQETFEKNLRLKNTKGQYNIMAYILSDQNSIPIRVSIFSGKTKADPLYSVKEFGNTCILYSLDKILEYGEVINIIQADEKNRKLERIDIPLFNYDVYYEAIVNSFVHNRWLTLNAPAISIFDDRIEILSHGGLPFDQDVEGFYNGASIPVNELLASIFLQLRISECSGRGVPKIINEYGKDAIKIERNRITVIIPFNNINNVEKKQDEVNIRINDTQQKILSEIRNNPNVTIYLLVLKLGLSEPTIKKNLKILKNKGLIERVGSTKAGYWKIIK